MRALWLIFAWLLIIAGALVFPPVSIVMLILLFVFRAKKQTVVVIRDKA